MKEFFILSLRHSPADGNALWWGPDNKGYTQNLLTAGRYTEAQVAAEPLYYNDGVNTRAVPCELAERHSFTEKKVIWFNAKSFPEQNVSSAKICG
jgi:hypothetical protein